MTLFFCFLNTEVRNTLRHHWLRWKTSRGLGQSSNNHRTGGGGRHPGGGGGGNGARNAVGGATSATGLFSSLHPGSRKDSQAVSETTR